MYLRLRDYTTVQVLAIGNFTLYFNSRVLILENCLYVPVIRRNLISITVLGQQGYSTSLKDIVVIKKDKPFIYTGTIIDGLYIVTLDAYELKNSVLESNSHVLPKKRKFSTFNEAYLWHLRLGHINPNRIQRLIKDGLLEPLDLESLLVCESCLEGKMTKRPFTTKGYRANNVLELIHTDVCGPMNVQARGGYKYFITFTDDYSRYDYVYLMRRKFEAFEKFKEFWVESEKQLGQCIKTRRSD
jgi:hypothetical protein